MSAAIQWSGPLLVGGAALLAAAIVGAALRPAVNAAIRPELAAILVVAAALLTVSLPLMYAAQAEPSGATGLAGYALLQVGILLLVVVSATPVLFPHISEPFGNHVLTGSLGIALTLGILLTGVATLQAGVFPRPAALLVLAGAAGFFFSFFVAEFLPPAPAQAANAVLGVLFPAGFAWIGLAMWTRSG